MDVEPEAGQPIDEPEMAEEYHYRDYDVRVSYANEYCKWDYRVNCKRIFVAKWGYPNMHEAKLSAESMVDLLIATKQTSFE